VASSLLGKGRKAAWGSFRVQQRYLAGKSDIPTDALGGDAHTQNRKFHGTLPDNEFSGDPMTTSSLLTTFGGITKLAMACSLAAGVLVPSMALAQPQHLGSAESFAVLAGSGVTNTGTTTVTGDVGVSPGTAGVENVAGFDPPSTLTEGSIHDSDAVAAQALLDASEAYDELLAEECTNDLSGGTLGVAPNASLGPGVYCFSGDASSSGTLTLTGAGPWVFRIAGSLTTAAASVVTTPDIDTPDTCNGSSVFWQVGGDAMLGQDSTFVGNLLAQGDTDAQNGIVLDEGATVDGRLLTLGSESTVMMEGNTVSACSFRLPLPVHAPVKVTGGGQITVSDTGPAGFATYGFNAKPPETTGGVTGHLNYLNHVSGLHVNGTVTDVDVVTLDTDESSLPPKMVRFSGTCGSGCTFSVIVEDNGEPGRDDRFGIVVVGSTADETTPVRVVRNGNIQVRLGLTTTTNQSSFRAGDVMALSASLRPGVSPPRADAYIVLQLPGGQLLSWTGNRLVPGLVPIARNIRPANYRAIVALLAVPSGVPTGTYTWLSGLTAPGTLNLVSDISARRFTIGQ
jgi:Ice-binding-like